MKGETKRYDADGKTDIAAIREIAGNYYLVIVWERYGVVGVYANLKDGSKMSFPERSEHFTIDLDAIVRKDIDGNETAQTVAIAVNEAVKKLSDHLEQSKSTEDAVLGALEANAEVHDE